MSNNPILRIAVALLANFMLLAFVLPALISAKSTLSVLLGFAVGLAIIPLSYIFIRQGVK